MLFPAIVFLLIVGAFLVGGGVLMGSDVTLWIGSTLWGAAWLLFLRSLWLAASAAYREHKLRKRLTRLRDRTYRPNAGLR
jgi:hypothetical protein